MKIKTNIICWDELWKYPPVCEHSLYHAAATCDHTECSVVLDVVVALSNTTVERDTAGLASDGNWKLLLYGMNSWPSGKHVVREWMRTDYRGKSHYRWSSPLQCAALSWVVYVIAKRSLTVGQLLLCDEIVTDTFQRSDDVGTANDSLVELWPATYSNCWHIVICSVTKKGQDAKKYFKEFPHKLYLSESIVRTCYSSLDDFKDDATGFT